MAEVARVPGLARQIALVMLVRWQTFRNGLRLRSEKMHVVGSIFLGLPIAVMILIASPALSFAAYAMAGSGKWVDLSLILWGIFLIWHLAPILSAALNPGFDGRNLLRFPLRFSAFFLLSTAYGVVDLYAASGILWHVAIGVGVSIARPDLAWWAALALSISVLMNLLFNRLLFSWLERVLAQRWLREIAAAALVLLFVGLQFSNVFFVRRGPVMMRALQRNAGVWSVLPPALPGIVLQHAADGEPGAALRTSGLLAIYAIGFGGLFAFRLRAQFTGEDLGESAAPVRQKIAVKGAAPSTAAVNGNLVRETRPFTKIFDAPVFAIFAKEVRYFYRNSMLMMNALMPLILIAFFTMTSSMPGRRGGLSFLGRYGGSLAYPSAAAYILLLTMNFCPNNLAFEGRGIDRLFLAPIRFRDVMLGKNLFHGSLLVLEALAALVLVVVTGHVPSVSIVLATWAGLLFAALIDLGTGNWLSIQFPRRFEFGARRQRPSGSTVLISFGIFFMEMGVIAATAAACIWFAGMWLLPLAYLAWSAAALAVYRFILEATSRQAENQRDALLEQLSR